MRVTMSIAARMQSGECVYHVQSSGCSCHARTKRIAARTQWGGCAFHIGDNKHSCAQSGGCACHGRDEKHCCAHAVERMCLPASARSLWRCEGLAPDHGLKPENKEAPEGCWPENTCQKTGGGSCAGTINMQCLPSLDFKLLLGCTAWQGPSLQMQPL